MRPSGSISLLAQRGVAFLHEAAPSLHIKMADREWTKAFELTSRSGFLRCLLMFGKSGIGFKQSTLQCRLPFAQTQESFCKE